MEKSKRIIKEECYYLCDDNEKILVHHSPSPFPAAFCLGPFGVPLFPVFEYNIAHYESPSD